MDDDAATISSSSSTSQQDTAAVRGHHSIILSGESGSGTYCTVMYVSTVQLCMSTAIVIAIPSHLSIHHPSLSIDPSIILAHLLIHPSS
jgi:hypothetical protein